MTVCDLISSSVLAHMKFTAFYFSFAFLFAVAICAPSVAQSSATREKQTLKGRVLAAVARPYGAGLGPLWQFFIFGVESEHEPNKIKPVLMAYLFHNFKLDPPLREDFFDHSKLYELTVVREPRCDEDVNTLSIVNNETVDGKPLRPSAGISFVQGAPSDTLKSDIVLPCYVFHRGDFRVK
jgi:hypothetical protein